jgi:hypothetical protein
MIPNLREYIALLERTDVTTTPAFQAWFSGSKAVDRQGRPLRLFHGTPYGGFDRFSSTKWKGIAGYFHTDPKFASISTGPLTPYEEERPSIYPVPPGSASGGRSIYPVYLAVKNPLNLRKIPGEQNISAEQFLRWSRLEVNASPEFRYWFDSPRVSKEAEANYIRSMRDQNVWSYLSSPRVLEIIKANGYDSIMYNEYGPAFVAFYPEQIKSIFNKGTFDGADARMSESATLLEFDAMRSVNNLGRPIASSPARLRNFWQWFDGSKIMTRQGQPIVLYHGTKSDFRAFDPNLSNSNTNTGVPHSAFVFSSSNDVAQSYAGQKTKDWGFTTDAEQQMYHKLLIQDDDVEAAFQYFKKHAVQDVKSYETGSNVMPVYLKMVKPLRVNARGGNWRNIYYDNDDWTTNDLMAFAKQKGHDGLIVRNVHDRQEGAGKAGDIFAVFSPAQIKSAIGNRGKFHSANGMIDEDEPFD